MASVVENPVVVQTNADGAAAPARRAPRTVRRKGRTASLVDVLNDALDAQDTLHERRHAEFESDRAAGKEHARGVRGARRKLELLLESHRAHAVIVALVVLDSVFVVAEVLLDVHNIQARCDDTTALLCDALPAADAAALDACAATHGALGTGDGAGARRRLSAGGGETPTEIALEILHVCSLTVLGVFLVEIALKTFAFGLALFKRPADLFDVRRRRRRRRCKRYSALRLFAAFRVCFAVALTLVRSCVGSGRVLFVMGQAVVVITSFALDLTVHDEKAVELLLVLRLWRCVLLPPLGSCPR